MLLSTAGLSSRHVLPNGSANTGIAITDCPFPFSGARNYGQIACDGSEPPNRRCFANRRGRRSRRPLSFGACHARPLQLTGDSPMDRLTVKKIMGARGPASRDLFDLPQCAARQNGHVMFCA
jgi:hypothetical protein